MFNYVFRVQRYKLYTDLPPRLLNYVNIHIFVDIFSIFILFLDFFQLKSHTQAIV